MEEHDLDLHEKVADIGAKTELILNNHLPHLKAMVDKIDNRLWWVLATIILGFITMIVVKFVF